MSLILRNLFKQFALEYFFKIAHVQSFKHFETPTSTSTVNRILTLVFLDPIFNLYYPMETDLCTDAAICGECKV